MYPDPSESAQALITTLHSHSTLAMSIITLAAAAACIMLTSVQQVTSEESFCTYTFRVPQPPEDQCGDDLHEQLGELRGQANTLIDMVKDLENAAGELNYVSFFERVDVCGNLLIISHFNVGSFHIHIPTFCSCLVKQRLLWKLCYLYMIKYL